MSDTVVPFPPRAARMVFICDCGREQGITEAEAEPASVLRCGGCRQVWGCVRARYGQPVWVRITAEETDLHRLMDDLQSDE